jgi:uncharacterized protein (TIGR02646 family)
MKPVKKPPEWRKYSPYDKAKPDLLSTLGEQCSYCERAAAPQDLHVEHIYPKKAHPSRETLWDNFLVACNTCNTYKKDHLGNGRQRGLLTRYLWPHLDNTANAFKYKATGKVDIVGTIPAPLKRAAEMTREMSGLLLSPAKAANYQKLGVAYDGATRRSQTWSMASDFRSQYLATPSAANAATIANGASRIGYFSIWMEVFHDQPPMRRELIRAFKADEDCFDRTNTAPVKKGRL